MLWGRSPETCENTAAEIGLCSENSTIKMKLCAGPEQEVPCTQHTRFCDARAVFGQRIAQMLYFAPWDGVTNYKRSSFSERFLFKCRTISIAAEVNIDAFR